MSQDDLDPGLRELLEKNAEIHNRYVAAKDGGVRHVIEKEQLAVKQAIQIAYPTFRPLDIAHDIKMHKDNIRGYEEATETIQKARSYRGDADTSYQDLAPHPTGKAANSWVSSSVVTAHPSHRTGLGLAAGTLALVSALMILLGSILPFYTLKLPSGAGQSPSVFTQGPANSVDAYAAEPITVLVLVIVAAVLLFATRRPGALGTVAGAWLVVGALLALGIQTTMMFVGYAFLSPLGAYAHHDAGGTVGLFGGLVLIATGIVALLDSRRTWRS